MQERKYLFIEEQECHDMIVQTFLANERDHYIHAKNLERFSTMLSVLEPGNFRDSIQKLHDDTMQRIKEVEAILDATESQMPLPLDQIASLNRLKAKGLL